MHLLNANTSSPKHQNVRATGLTKRLDDCHTHSPQPSGTIACQSAENGFHANRAGRKKPYKNDDPHQITPMDRLPKPKAWSHERSQGGKDEWLTPPEILRALGDFDLDPCAPAAPPWPTAKNFYTIKENGLIQPWFGRVWLNPPYGKETYKWLARLANHRNGIALVFARTETRMFFDWVWSRANAVLFLRGRLTFLNVDGSKPANTGGAPSALIAYGRSNVRALAESGLDGKLISLKAENWPSGPKHQIHIS